MTTYTSNWKDAGQAAALYPDKLCMEMCPGLKDQIEYDATGLKRLGELRQLDMEELIRDMIKTAKEFVSDNIADETSVSHGDLPPMTDEGRRAADQDQSELGGYRRLRARERPSSECGQL